MKRLIGVFVVLAGLFWAALAAADEPELDALNRNGCLGCHSADGTRRVGPTLLGVMGRSVEAVRADGKSATPTIDEDFIRESIANPNAMVRVGFVAGTMPAFTLSAAETEAILKELKALSAEDTMARHSQEESPLWPVVVFTFAFVFGHLILSSGWIRSALVGKLGEPRFQGVYAIVAGISMTGMFWAQATAPYIPLWPTFGWMAYIPVVVMPFVVVLWVAGYSTRSATAAGQTDVLQEEEPVRGIGKVTRHPANCGFGLWALTHIVTNGDLAALIVFGGILFLAIAGTWHIESRRHAQDPEGWARLKSVTSIVPFVAIAQGRNRVSLNEIGYKRIAIAIGIYVVFLSHGHDLMMGVSPLPW